LQYNDRIGFIGERASRWRPCHRRRRRSATGTSPSSSPCRSWIPGVRSSCSQKIDSTT